MAVPERAVPTELAGYLAVLARAVFAAGLSWASVERRWAAYERLFARFDPEIVAAFDGADIERIVADGGVIRSRKKIAATVANARALLALERNGGIPAYLESFASYDDLARDLRTRFAYVGEFSAYYFVFFVGGRVPRFEAWERTVAGDHPRMREAVARARSRGYVDENG